MRSRFEVYCDMLHYGLLSIRNFPDNAEYCRAQADHLHNIPGLLRNFENEGLHRYYWEVERPSFISQSRPEWLGRFPELWAELEEASRGEMGR